MTFTAARESIRLAHSYFVPDRLTCDALIHARARGVAVEIIVPGPIMDTQFVRAASRSRWKPLLQAGVRIWEYQPTMYHCKIMVVDGCWTSVGSTNLDNRSFRLNDEANLNVLDGPFAAAQVRQFDADRACSREVTLRDWTREPWPRRTMEWLAGLARSQL
jgi:cardiolipin synthase